MAQRPNHIDLGSRSFDPTRVGTPSPSLADLPSPRTGDVPPALSPLDALAFQGRMLARKFEESQQNGHRISRLPPVTVANEFARPRPGFFNAQASPVTPMPSGNEQSEPPGIAPELARPDTRPRSVHPFLQSLDDVNESGPGREPLQQTLATAVEEDETDDLTATAAPKFAQDYFSGTRASSPEPLLEINSVYNNVTQPVDTKDNKISNRPPHLVFRKTGTDDSLRSTGSGHSDYKTDLHRSNANLALPRSPAFSRSPRTQSSIRSVRNDSGDDSDATSYLGDPFEQRLYDRKLSASSMASRPRSPFSPIFAPPRSPSAASDYSVAGNTNLLPRSSINFSRPMSRNEMNRAERPSFDSRPSLDNQRLFNTDSPQLRPSFDVLSIEEPADSPSLPNAPFASDRDTPVSLTDDEISDLPEPANPAPSYIYAKYSLPRGRVVSRDSMPPMDPITHKFEWEQPMLESNVVPIRDRHSQDGPKRELLQQTRKHADSDPEPESKPRVPRSRFREDLSSMNDPLGPLLPPAPIDVNTRSRSVEAPRGRISSSSPNTAPKGHKANPSFPPASKTTTTSNVRSRLNDQSNALPTLSRSSKSSQTPFAAPPDQLTPEEHLSKGIECHEEGRLQKSTYHLRIAARAGLPTAMLLYALACRHGWGMRAHQAEGVAWLRKALDSIGIDFADEDIMSGAFKADKKNMDPAAQRTQKAQFALSIYELGVSYLNGWGVAQDRQLAIRCFEIAGAWGDADALAEAGFCYAKGVGCKKDLNKAADYYRKAEKKGIAMTGNSWIYKEKYMPKDGSAAEDRKGRSADKDKDRKPRDKSRTRTIFGGRKKPPNMPTPL